MFLKRIFKRLVDDEGNVKTDESGKPLLESDADGNPVCLGVRVLRSSTDWRPSTKIVQRGINEGWILFEDGIIKLKLAEGGTMDYKITAGPGFYCSICGEPLASGIVAREHVAGVHADDEAPAHRPAGYERRSYFVTVREEA